MADFDIKCVFCQQTPEEVVETNCCQNIFCWSCILDRKICKCGSIINIDKVAVVQELQDILDQNTLDYCKNVGCNYTGSRNALREHNNTCEYRAIACPVNPKCGTFVYRDLEEHNSVCPSAIVTCEYCERTDMRQYLAKHTCPESLVDCVCGEKVKIRYLGSHKESFCRETIIFCPYSKYGCHYSDTRADVNVHLSENQNEHLQMLDSYNYQKDQKIRQLTGQLNAPLPAQISRISKRVTQEIVTTVPESRLVKQGKNLIDRTTKAALFKLLFLFFLATLLPMKYFLVRFIFTAIVMRKVWVSLFGPAIRSARYSRSTYAAVEQMIYLILFVILTVLFAIYSKFL